MAIYSVEEKAEHKLIIRRLMLFNPAMSVTALIERLKKSDRPLDISYSYAQDLVRDIRTERLKAVEEETKEDLYVHMKDTVEFVNQQLRSIAQEEKLVYSKTKDGVPVESPETRIFAQNNRIKALNSVIDNLVKLVNLKMDLGIIERKVGTMDHVIIDAMSALKKIRNGNYTTALDELIPALPSAEVGTPANKEN